MLFVNLLIWALIGRELTFFSGKKSIFRHFSQTPTTRNERHATVTQESQGARVTQEKNNSGAVVIQKSVQNVRFPKSEIEPEPASTSFLLDCRYPALGNNRPGNLPQELLSCPCMLYMWRYTRDFQMSSSTTQKVNAELQPLVRVHKTEDTPPRTSRACIIMALYYSTS